MIDCEKCKNSDEKCLCSIYKVIIPEIVRKSPCKYFEERRIMGMYTEINIGVKFKNTTPLNVINILRYMLSDIESLVGIELPSHPLFETDRWHMMLVCDGYYFDSQTESSLHYDEFDKSYYLNVRSNFKNYDDEIDKFLHFIRPYLDNHGFIGYTRYEEFDHPTLIYNDKWNGVIQLFHINEDITSQYNKYFEEIKIQSEKDD